MLLTILAILLSFYWLLRETHFLTVHLLIGPEEKPVELERLTWSECVARYGRKQVDFTKYNEEPICGWDWLQKNTHPIPQAKFDLETGGVRYHMQIRDTVVLKDVLAATKYNRPKTNGQLHFTKNKLGGVVAPLPAKAH